jgi:hypothetical protein
LASQEATRQKGYSCRDQYCGIETHKVILVLHLHGESQLVFANRYSE